MRCSIKYSVSIPLSIPASPEDAERRDARLIENKTIQTQNQKREKL